MSQIVIKKGGWILLLLSLFSIAFFSNISVLPFGLYDEKRIVECFLLILGSFLFIILYSKMQITGLGYKVRMLFFALISLLCISAALALLSSWAFLQIGWYVLLVQFTFLCAFLYQQNKQRYIKLLICALVALAGLYVVHVLGNTITSFFQEGWPTWPHQAKYSIIVDGRQVNPQGFLGFTNMRILNHLQTWSLPLLVLGMLYYKERLIPGFWYLLFAIIGGWWMLVFASDARGTMVASVISLLVVGYIYRGRAKEFILTTIGVAITGLVAYYLLFLLPDQGAREILTRADSSGRIEVWTYTLNLISTYPFFGIGPMHFSYIGFNPPASSPHNIIFQSVVEWGLPAAFTAVILTIAGYVKFIHQKVAIDMKKESLVHIALVVSLSAGFAHSMVSSLFNTPLSQLMFCLILGWAIGHYFEHSGSPLFQERKKVSWTVWVVGVLLVVITVFVAQKVGTDISKLEQRKALYIKQQKEKGEGQVILYPRFWQQGKIGLEE